MPFVNVEISATDRKYFGLDLIDDVPSYGKVKSNSWTMDRSRNTYLRIASNEREELVNRTTWHFYRKGKLYEFDVSLEKLEGPGGGHRAAYYNFLNVVEYGRRISPSQELLDNFVQELREYADGGIFRRAKSFEVILSVA